MVKKNTLKVRVQRCAKPQKARRSELIKPQSI
jgi:hypothetical protein